MIKTTPLTTVLTFYFINNIENFDIANAAHSIELSREGMRRLYRNADAFVLPTRGMSMQNMSEL